ncbi:TIGR01777 family oxidoreductase [Riemerella columbina]|uniref:TIGR01777 family oxidoreductase n=1 Tax=Riemerella columbina TaxID=103810 RepID=UPI000376C522|nr:TIGR01777 family oxidoreductase [Riemerella columbina]
MKIVLSGGTGYAGKLIQNHFKEAEFYILTRGEKISKQPNIHYVQWDGKTIGDWKKALEDTDVLINLAGKNINCRFTEENKEAILQSRIKSTELLGKAIEQCQNPPKMWLNASTVAVYKESYEEVRTEDSPTNGEDFLSQVGQQWEAAFHRFAEGKTKKVAFRISLIMGDHEGSAYQTLKKLVKFGGGGKAGSGKQRVAWISEQDFVNALEFIIDEELEGAFNFCTTNAPTNAQLMKALREKYHMPFGLPAPEFLIKIGAVIMGTAPELVLRSQNVYPKRLTEVGFVFEDTNVKTIESH